MTARARPSYAPRLMRVEEAARYVALQKTKFLEEVSRGNIAQPVRSQDRGRVVAWDVNDLDFYVDSLRDKAEAADDWSGQAA